MVGGQLMFPFFFEKYRCNYESHNCITFDEISLALAAKCFLNVLAI